jgi:hypothetical protein
MWTRYFNGSNNRSILINSDQLQQHAGDKWDLGLIPLLYYDYSIVATLGTPVSGKSMCISAKLSCKLANRNQPRSSMIYLAPNLLVVMLMAI